MAKNSILRLSYFVATFPLALISMLAFKFNWWDFKGDVIKCTEVVAKYERIRFSEELLGTLEIAEDHRHKFHFGVDHFALCRAIFSTLKGSVQGASTIEQQFVRVVIDRYQRTISRKLLEQLLAVYVSSRLKKERIATAYLCIAYYGKSQVSALALNNITNLASNSLKYADAIPIISRLKYPEPSVKTKNWLLKFENRNRHIAERINTANKLLHAEKLLAMLPIFR